MTQALAPIAEHTDLVATIERARALLDEGDLKAARLIAEVAYDQAKAAASSAQRVKASRQLIEKAQRMQADALYVETQATIRMADAVDEAQSAGKLARQGRPKNITDENVFSLDDVGLDAQGVHAARKVRNAERANPGFVTQIIKARLAEGLEPSRAALKKAAGHAVGTKSRTKAERGSDSYFTAYEALPMLLALESFSALIKEPACGAGHISKVLEAVGYDVLLADIEDRGTCDRHGEMQQVGDFTLSDANGTEGVDIVSNPPYGRDIMNRFIAHALKVHRPRKMAMLLNLNAMCGCEDKDRLFIMDECPPSRVYVHARRLPMMHQEGWQGNKQNSQMNTAWFIWEQNDDGSYGSPNGFTTIRIDWKAYLDAEPLLPGAGGRRVPFRFTLEVDEFARETPRKTVDERVGEELERARRWTASGEVFDARTLRKGIAVRPIVAAALIDELLEAGEIEACEGGYQANAVTCEAAA